MPEKDMDTKTGVLKHFSPKNKGVAIDHDKNWFTVVGGAWEFAKNCEKGDKVEYGTNNEGNIVFLKQADGSSQSTVSRSSSNKSKSEFPREAGEGVDEKLSQIEKFVAKQYDENHEMLKGLVESVNMVREELSDIKEVLDIKDVE